MKPDLQVTLTDPGVKRCPYHAHDLIRAESAAYRDPVSGAYLVTRYADVRRLAKDSERLSNATGLIPSLEGSTSEAVNALYTQRGLLPVSTLVTADPPEHRFYRQLVDKAFLPRRVQAMHSDIRRLAGNLVGEMAAKSDVEFVEHFAVRLPVMVIADQLGIPRNDVALFKRWSDAAIEQIDPQLTPERELELTRLIIDMQSYFIRHAKSLRRRPADHLFSDLVHADVDGRRLDDRELCSILQQVLVAGNETTTSALASLMVLLVDEPGRADTLFEHPDRIPGFVEETLRLGAPVQSLLRRALVDIELEGATIPAGAIVQLVNAAANRDPTVFPTPHQIALDRTNPRAHMAFGVGIHHCIGSQLARAELTIALEELVQRLCNFRYVDGPDSVDYMTGHTFGPNRIHITFDQRSAPAQPPMS